MKTYPSISKAIEALIKIETAEEGYCEKKSASHLDSKTTNAGKNNYTKYWRDLNEVYKLMGKPKGWAGGPDWSWCGGLQSWSFIKAFGVDGARKLLKHLPFISCQRLADIGPLHSKPKVGDIVLFYNGSRHYHTGLVIKVNDNKFNTIEGNTSSGSAVVPNGGMVCKKSYTVSSKTRFFRPDYSKVVKKEPKKPTQCKVVGTINKDTKVTAKPVSSTTKKTTIKKEVIMIVGTKKNPVLCREKAKGTAKVLGKFKKGSKLTLIEKSTKSYYKMKGIDMNTGKTLTGYVASKYLK